MKLDNNKSSTALQVASYSPTTCFWEKPRTRPGPCWETDTVEPLAAPAEPVSRPPTLPARVRAAFARPRVPEDYFASLREPTRETYLNFRPSLFADRPRRRDVCPGAIAAPHVAACTLAVLARHRDLLRDHIVEQWCEPTGMRWLSVILYGGDFQPLAYQVNDEYWLEPESLRPVVPGSQTSWYAGLEKALLWHFGASAEALDATASGPAWIAPTLGSLTGQRVAICGHPDVLARGGHPFSQGLAMLDRERAVGVVSLADASLWAVESRQDRGGREDSLLLRGADGRQQRRISLGRLYEDRARLYVTQPTAENQVAAVTRQLIGAADFVLQLLEERHDSGGFAVLAGCAYQPMRLESGGRIVDISRGILTPTSWRLWRQPTGIWTLIDSSDGQQSRSHSLAALRLELAAGQRLQALLQPGAWEDFKAQHDRTASTEAA